MYGKMPSKRRNGTNSLIVVNNRYAALHQSHSYLSYSRNVIKFVHASRHRLFCHLRELGIDAVVNPHHIPLLKKHTRSSHTRSGTNRISHRHERHPGGRDKRTLRPSLLVAERWE
jgi:hypothetical protein